MRKIRQAIIRVLMGRADYLLIEHQNGEGFATLKTDDANDFLFQVTVNSVEGREPIKEFFLAVAEKYLKEHESDRLKFSKAVYNK